MLLMNRACTVFPFLCSETHRTKILLPSYLSLNIPILHYMRLQETFYRANLSMLHFKYSSILQFKSCLLSNKTWIALSPVKWLSAGGVKKIGNHFNFWTKAAKSRKWLQAHKGYFVKGGSVPGVRGRVHWVPRTSFHSPSPLSHLPPTKPC